MLFAHVSTGDQLSSYYHSLSLMGQLFFLVSVNLIPEVF